LIDSKFSLRAELNIEFKNSLLIMNVNSILSIISLIVIIKRVSAIIKVVNLNEKLNISLEAKDVM